jgi:hypothetical protein
MQTNREDCGNRYREVILPNPPSKEWANSVAKPFADYFTALATAREEFRAAVSADSFRYVASASAHGNVVAPEDCDGADNSDVSQPVEEARGPTRRKDLGVLPDDQPSASGGRART